MWSVPCLFFSSHDKRERAMLRCLLKNEQNFRVRNLINYQIMAIEIYGNVQEAMTMVYALSEYLYLDTTLHIIYIGHIVTIIVVSNVTFRRLIKS